MADEIKINMRMQVANGAYKQDIRPSQLIVHQSTLGGVSGVQEIGTSIEAVAMGDVSTKGYAFLQNLDDTNFITLYMTYLVGTVAFCFLRPGEFAVLRLSSGALKATADTAACKLYYLVLED